MFSFLLIILLILTIMLASIFAGAETGIYQLSRLRLRLGIEEKRFSFVILANIMQDSAALLISMLIGTNLAYYFITSVVTYLLLSRFETAHTAEFFAAVITAPVLFVFSELIPKNIFFYRADNLMPRIAPILFVFHKFFTWCQIVPLLKSVSRLFSRLTGTNWSSKTTIDVLRSSHLKTIFQETHEEGFLSTVQTGIIDRLEKISNLSIKYAMTPLSKTQLIDVNSNNVTLLNKLKKCPYTRLLVYENIPLNIIGFINIYDCLNSKEQFSDLRGLINPIRRLRAETIVSNAINIMQSENQKIVLVIRTAHAGKEKTIGIITMKDLVEELLGELTEW